MDEEQQYERFDMDNDFEQGDFINGEFVYGRKRQKKAQTKDDQLYGIFADGDSDSDGGGRRRGKPREKADYSRPVEFISTGLAAGSQPQSKQEAVKAEPAAETTAALSSGLGFKPAESADAESDEEAEDQAALLPGAFGKRYKLLHQYPCMTQHSLCQSQG